MHKKIKSKKGVASFYIVAFSTLILIVVATSFAAVIISEMERTANDDLAQSAYDSALAGVEDAKLAVYKYQYCISNPSQEGCDIVKDLVESPAGQNNCDQVAEILGRIGENQTEVPVQEETGNNSMQQAYTCVMFTGINNNYKTTLTASRQSKTIRASFDTDGEDSGAEVHASDIKSVKVSWYSGYNMESNSNNELNYGNFDESKKTVIFPSVGTESASTPTPTPPVIAVGLIQAPDNFKLSDFEKTIGNNTNRGLIYLVPTKDVAGNVADGNYVSSGVNNTIGASAFSKSNNKEKTNKPYTVKCGTGDDYACTATIELPSPINGVRSDDNFAIVISLPYSRPDTDVMVEFLCADGTICSYSEIDENGIGQGEGSNVAKLEWVQVEVDSTGRANDLYRRVEMRLENDTVSLISGMNALEILGDINKNISTKCEWDFGQTCFE